MTHIIAWNRGGDVWLFADSVATGGPVAEPVSSFGETLRNSAGEWVGESLLKITRVGEVALGFSGLVRKWDSFARAFRGSHALGQSPREAFATAAASVLPLESRDDLAVAMAYPTETGAGLTVFNAGGDLAVRDLPESAVLQLGSGGEATLSDAHSAIAAVGEQASHLEGRHQFGLALAALQMRAFMSPLPAEGIGGVLAACRVDADGFHWQPDMSYAGVNPFGNVHFFASVLARHNAIWVQSSLLDQAFARGARHSDGCDALCADVTRTSAGVLQEFALPSREYLALFGRAGTGLVLAEMRRVSQTKELILSGLESSTGEHTGFGVAFSETVEYLIFPPVPIVRPSPWAVLLTFLPFEPPPDPGFWTERLGLKPT